MIFSAGVLKRKQYLPFKGVIMADIYTVTTTLDPDEAFGKVKRLPMGNYKYTLIRTTGDDGDITLEAELVTSGVRKKVFDAKCPNIVTDVGFKVENNDDAWEITVTNSSSTGKATVTNKLTKV